MKKNKLAHVHKPKTIDKLATKLAEMERIVLVKTELDEEEIVTILKKIS